jgi:hypothetical protein
VTLKHVNIDRTGYDEDGNFHGMPSTSGHRMPVYKVGVKGFFFYIKAYNRADALFRSRHRFPIGKFFDPKTLTWK